MTSAADKGARHSGERKCVLPDVNSARRANSCTCHFAGTTEAGRVLETADAYLYALALTARGNLLRIH